MLLLGLAFLALHLRSQAHLLPAYAMVRIRADGLSTNNPALAGTNRSNADKAIDLIHSDSFTQMVGKSAGIPPRAFRITKAIRYKDTDIISLQILARDLDDAKKLYDALDQTLHGVLYEPFVYSDYLTHPPQHTVDLLIAWRPAWWREVCDDIQERRISGHLGL